MLVPRGRPTPLAACGRAAPPPCRGAVTELRGASATITPVCYAHGPDHNVELHAFLT